MLYQIKKVIFYLRIFLHVANFGFFLTILQPPQGFLRPAFEFDMTDTNECAVDFFRCATKSLN